MSGVDQLVAKLNRLASGSTALQKKEWLKNHLAKWGVTRGQQGSLSLQQLKSALRSLNVPFDGAEDLFQELDQEGRGSIDVDRLSAFLTAPEPPKRAPAPPQRAGAATSVAPGQAWPEDKRAARGMAADPSARDDPLAQMRYVTETRNYHAPNHLGELQRFVNTRFGDPWKAWQWCDNTRDGNLTLDELERAFRAWNVANPSSAAREVYSVLDKNKDSRINYNEFREAVQFGGRHMDSDTQGPAKNAPTPETMARPQFQHTLDGGELYRQPASPAMAGAPRGMDTSRSSVSAYSARQNGNGSFAPPQRGGGDILPGGGPDPSPPRKNTRIVGGVILPGGSGGAPPGGGSGRPMDLRGRGPFGAGGPPPQAGGPLAKSSAPTQRPPAKLPPPPPGPPLQAQGALADAVTDQFRKAVIARGGAHGIHTLSRTFRIFDCDGNKQLGISELQDGLTHYGLHLEKKDVVTLMAALDKDGAASSLSFDEFMVGIRGVLNERRTQLVGMAFEVLDRDGSGVVDMEDMKATYNTSHHPEVLDGQMGEDEALHHMLDQFDGGEHDGKVTLDEFHDYYKNVSASVDNDDYFELMIRNAWHIPGGEGWCANTSNTRVLVTFTDGHQQVVCIENDLGLDLHNDAAVRKRLASQGVTNIAKIELCG